MDSFSLSSDSFTSYNNFIDFIISSADLHVPLKKPTRGFKVSTPWWDAECTTAVAERKAAEKAYCQNMTTHNFINYKNAAAKYRKLTCKKKKQGWTDFCENLSPELPPLLFGSKLDASEILLT
ncbi:putative pol-like protein [Operophtera brumata]|uniref:Putative pol-like protein n=1 Tax=Operophtera brumata TaxID=104452 RepID=A0A0L7LUM1_OPEBR|nr:putative pol-like protein [Operophtera brumata]